MQSIVEHEAGDERPRSIETTLAGSSRIPLGVVVLRSTDLPSAMVLDAPDWLHEIDHTGDIGIQVTADSLPQLFERAAAGTFHVLTDLTAVQPADETSITVEGRDREALMVRWLSELNYRHTVDRRLFCDFAVESIADTGDGLTLTGTARGEPIDPARHTVYTEIKAITFHGMEIRETDTGWAVQVIFDM
jgi:SHS2 domain-containing protein